LVVKDLMDGRLVAPYKIALNTGGRFRFLCRDGAQDKPQIKAFKEWIVAEVEKGQHVTDAMTLVTNE